MTRFLDWLDESAAGVIRIAYLLAGVIAVASYFSDGNVPRGFSDFLNAILPWALAGALEVHTYLTARRVRAAWQDWSAAALGSDEHERAWAQLKLNLGILSGLLAFSMYNQLQYLAATWTPPHTPLTPPGFWPYLIRAIITPAAFMAAAFLAPVGEGLAVQVQSQAHALAVMTFKVATQQWKRRLRQMQQSGQDVTGALVQLVDDPTERRMIAAIWQAMQHPGELPAPETPAALPSALDAPTGPQRPPTGPGTPTATPSSDASNASGSAAAERSARPAVLRLTPAQPRKRAAARASGSSKTGAKSTGVRTPRKSGQSLEADARAAWASGARTVNAMMTLSGMSRNAAGGWVRTLKAEQATDAASASAPLDAGQLAQ